MTVHNGMGNVDPLSAKPQQADIVGEDLTINALHECIHVAALLCHVSLIEHPRVFESIESEQDRSYGGSTDSKPARFELSRQTSHSKPATQHGGRMKLQQVIRIGAKLAQSNAG